MTPCKEGADDCTQSWIFASGFEDKETHTIYIFAFYWIFEVITTVGYGDITGSTTGEYLFSMCVEFIGLTFFSFLTGTISVMFSGDQSFEALINARMEELDLWLLRLENCNKEEKIPNKLYHSIKEFIQDAFIYDFNLIIEEFRFYDELPASIQNQISESLFKGFKQNFNNFFLNTDIGFQNQFAKSTMMLSEQRRQNQKLESLLYAGNDKLNYVKSQKEG